MKNFHFYLFAFLLAFSACQKEDEGMPVIDDDGPTVPVPEDTLVLQPTAHAPGDTTFGLVRAVWQDSFLWVGSASARCHDYHTSHPNKDYFFIQFRTYETETGFNFRRENLSFQEIPKDFGTFEISLEYGDLTDNIVRASFSTNTDDGDVLEDFYRVDETATGNQLTITEVDTVNQIYKGTFTVSFEIATTFGKQNPDNPDKMHFRDAEFWVQLKE